MHQTSLLDDSVSGPSRAVVGIAGSDRGLTPAQRKFNQLIERLTQQRQELDRWREFRRSHTEQIAAHYEPAVARLREKQVAMLRFLDRTLDGKALNGRERTKVRAMLDELLTPLLAESRDPDLVRIHDKYAPQCFGDEQQEKMDFMRALASDGFGIDVDAYPGSDSPDELADWLDEQVASRRREPPVRARKKSAKAQAREALREQAARGATRAVREVFRKLVSELHPDRETDPAEQARKTELMQRVNRAYEADDLLALFELQLSIEQINAATLAGLATERLHAYIHVLEEQSQRLREELAELVAPFAAAVQGASARKLTPATVQRALEDDIRGVNTLARRLAADLERFRDVAVFKRELRAFEFDPFAEFDPLDEFVDLVFSGPPVTSSRRPKRSRRRRR
jgi:hypothetical protein